MQQTLDDIAEVAGYLWQKGWAERNGGNLTVNITDLVGSAFAALPPLVANVAIGKSLGALPGQIFYVKGTGRRMRNLAAKPLSNGCIIRIRPDGAHYDIIYRQPVAATSELPSHLEVQNYLLESGSTCRATLHTHPIELVAISHIPEFLDSKHLTETLWSMIPETLGFAPRGIGVVPYALPGSQQLADATMDEIKKHNVVLWEKHGVFAIGDDIFEAFDEIDVLNKAAQIYMTACNMGQRPEGLTPKAVKEIQKAFHHEEVQW